MSNKNEKTRNRDTIQEIVRSKTELTQYGLSTLDCSCIFLQFLGRFRLLGFFLLAVATKVSCSKNDEQNKTNWYYI